MSVDQMTDHEVIDRFEAAGQGHVFSFWEELSTEQRRRLVAQATAIDLGQVSELTHRYIDSPKDRYFRGDLECADIIQIPRTEQERKEAATARRCGTEAISSDKVAALLVAGGQATRLGFRHPKGMFKIGPISGKSLYRLHAEKILATEKKYDSRIPWYIMTSEGNHDETVQFFDQHNCFGLDRDGIFFFKQGMIPALDAKGKLFLDAKDHIFVNPDGHGGVLSAIERSGALRDMQQRGIELLFYFQVDNVLINVCDPVFIGYHLLRGAEMSAKIVRKRNAQERIGVIGKVAGRLSVIEYSDLPEQAKEAFNPDGSLKYWAGSIAIHVFNVDFLERENRHGLKLPFHVAYKKIPYIGQSGQRIEPAEPNGYKFEQFVFDALGDARAAAIMEVAREEEFSPVKNRDGEDSPATARRDLIRLFSNWLEKVGREIPRKANGDAKYPIEISPLFALEAEDLDDKLPDRLDFQNGLYLEQT